MRRLRVWLVTGTPARGSAFALDFLAAVYRGFTGRRSRDQVR